MFSRRNFILAGSLTALAPGLTLASAPTEKRLVVILLRGAMDGLSAIAPVGDPNYASARGDLALQNGVKLDAMFARHPSLATFGAAFEQKQALAIHAIASPSRDRSHFDAQNVMETGGIAPYVLKDGWLNRALTALPAGANKSAVAIAQSMPVILRGSAAASSYAPSQLPNAPNDLLRLLSNLYSHDPLLGPQWNEALRTKSLAETMGSMEQGQGRDQLASLATIAARLLTAPDGARIAVLDHGGWDTHATQNGRINNQLRFLDDAFAALKTGLGEHWSNTIVVAMTEFGRAVAANGTGGTDHGTGGAALLLGGAVNGGRVIADWPGLRSTDLFEGRDLKPTVDLRSLIKGLLGDHMHVSASAMDNVVFPDSSLIRPMQGLVKA